jgi:dUTP pyrophosphatase
MKIKMKKFSSNAVLPKYSNPGDAGLDLVCTNVHFSPDGYVEYDTSIGVEIPEGYVGLIFPRSSMSKFPTRLANSVGVIDSGYRGSIKVRMRPDLFKDNLVHEKAEDGTVHAGFWIGSRSYYKEGDKIAQLVVVPYAMVEIEEVQELSTTARDTGGFGSTGV